jgi:hypothetical protein
VINCKTPDLYSSQTLRYLQCFVSTARPGTAAACCISGVSAALEHTYDSDRYLASWLDALQQRLSSGKLVLNRVRVLEGLEGAKEGLQLVADGKLSGEKAVVHVDA